MSPIISVQTWLQFTPETRHELRRIFNIPMTGGVEVVDNHVMSDGTLPRDLQVVTLKALQDVLDSSSANFFELLQEMVDTIEHREEPKAFETIQKETDKNAKELIDAIDEAAQEIFNKDANNVTKQKRKYVKKQKAS